MQIEKQNVQVRASAHPQKDTFFFSFTFAENIFAI